MTVDHDGARQLMPDGVEGRLDPTQERDLALHLVSCTECKQLYEGLQHAHPALAAIGVGTPSAQSVDTAVRRARAVLAGQADPGPLGTGPLPAAPPSGDAPVAPATGWMTPETTDTGPLLGDEAVAGEAAPHESPDDATADDPSESVIVISSSTVSEPTVATPPPAPIPSPAPPPLAPQPASAPPPAPPQPGGGDRPRPEPAPERPAPPPAAPAPPPAAPERTEVRPPARPEPGPRAPEPVIPATLGPPPSAEPRPTRISSSTLGPPAPSRADEVDQLFDEDYGPPPRRAERAEGASPGVGPWLAAIAVTILLAVLAAVLLTRGQGIIGGGADLPTADAVRDRVRGAFTDMKSLKTSFTIRRLSLYRTAREEGSLVYSFANGEYSGRFVYDRAEGYREEVTLTVRDKQVDEAKIVHTDAETRSIVGNGDGRLVVEQRPPLGPPDGQLRAELGVLEESVGVVARLLTAADDLEVVEQTSQDGRELYRVRFAVTADELTRADQIEVFLDSRTFLPAVIVRSISRSQAGVLGPGEVLTDDAITTAFGDAERVTTEQVELTNTVLDDIILPGDLALQAPQGSEPQTRDAGFERVSSAQAGGKVPFAPLFPRTLPEGFEEQLVATYSGEQRTWGPGGRFPAPDGIVHSTYFDGTSTVAVTQRHFPSGTFALDTSPLQAGALPVTVRSVERDAKRISFGVSPETVPHVYGFLGNVFVVVSGYVPTDTLVEVYASLAEAPRSAASPDPNASPGTTATPVPTVAATSSPSGSLPGEP